MIQKGYKKAENIFRQIAEEKPYLVFPFNQRRFHEAAQRVLGSSLRYDYVRDWLMGYRRKNNKLFK